MSKKNIAFFLFCLLFFSQFAVKNIAQSTNPRHPNEQLVIKALQTIIAAQITYSVLSDYGDYGSNLDLREAKYIDAVLADGNKYGYYFMFSSFRRTETSPSKFYVTATPQQYNKTGKMSFYIDEKYEIHGADKGGWLATKSDPIIDPCAEYEYEKCAIAALRNVIGAQATYQSSVGNGSFGTFKQLYAAGLTHQKLASGLVHGYRFTLTILPRTSSNEPSFRVSAVPAKYGITGIKSFYIELDGIVYGADKKGKPADKKDPAIDLCSEEEERCAASDLQTIHSAQITYQATVGNGSFGSLNELYTADLISKNLAGGVFHGYRFTLTVVPRTSETPTSFKVSAVPEKYGSTGRRSFCINTNGVIYGADKNGEPADENDPLY